MAVAVQEVVDAVLAAVESECGPQLVAGWISERYRELSNKVRFRHLLTYAELTLPAVMDDGTVTVTGDSAIVVGDTTAQAAWTANPTTTIGRFLRIDGQQNWFKVVGVNSDGDLVLDSPYVPPFSTTTPYTLADATYRLVARFHRLAPDVRHLGLFTHPRLHDPLIEVDHQELDQSMTSRILVADVPRFWAERGADTDGTKLIEVYPFAKTPQFLPYTYFAIAPVLTLDSNLPNEIDSYVLKTGALIDVHRWEFAKALRMNQPDVAATWRNEMNTLVTRWEDKIRDAVKADRMGYSGPAFQLHTQGFPTGDNRTIRTGYDYVWNKGNRP